MHTTAVIVKSGSNQNCRRAPFRLVGADRDGDRRSCGGDNPSKQGGRLFWIAAMVVAWNFSRTSPWRTASLASQ